MGLQIEMAVVQGTTGFRQRFRQRLDFGESLELGSALLSITESRVSCVRAVLSIVSLPRQLPFLNSRSALLCHWPMDRGCCGP
jgi:hypothetical protein